MTADVITGPWKKIDKTEKELEIAKVLTECDQITSDCVVAVLQILVENGIAPDDPDDESIVYIMFLTELLKAITYKNVDIEHPFQDIADMLSGFECATNNDKHYYVDYNLVSDVIDYLKSKEKDPA
tara:strand:+ start:301 stop:678 length:378 start_codon:yes stop_codon:yes gene_type:complete